MGDHVKIVFLTTDDRIYLPAFFDRVLASRGEETEAVYIVPPLYKGQTSRAAAWRYYRTFGARGVFGLATRLLQARAGRRSIESVCERRGVVSGEIKDVNAAEFLADLRRLNPDLLVSVSCPQIFKRPLLEVPAIGCLNVHGSQLPNYRGIMPSFWMLANGERQAGVSVYFMNERIDAGDLCAQRVFPISPTETLDEFLRRSKLLAADLLLEVLDAIENGTVERRPLDLTQGSYYSWPDRDAVRRFRAAGRRLS